MGKAKRRRPYDASGRQLRALETRERILDVARKLFAERGYAETTIEAIAEAADVAAPTVYAAFQSKRGVLSSVMKRQVAGVPGGPPLLETDEPRAINADPDPRSAVSRFIRHLVGVQERAIPTYEIMKSAARVEPDVAELLANMQHYRFSNLESLARRLDNISALRDGLTVEDAARTLWAITSPEVRQMLAAQAGWSTDRYVAWLEDILPIVLLEPAKRRSKTK